MKLKFLAKSIKIKLSNIYKELGSEFFTREINLLGMSRDGCTDNKIQKK